MDTRTGPTETAKTEKATSSEVEAPVEYPRDPGRLRAALSVLRGERLVPLQLQFEWLEYQQIFDDLLKRFSAQLARQAKAEKKRLKSQLEPESRKEPPASPAPLSSADHKANLRSRAAALRGLPSAPQPPLNGQHHPEEVP